MVFRQESLDDIAFVEGLLAEGSGTVIVDVRRLGSGESVEIVISHPSGNVSIDDCVALSNSLIENAEYLERFGSETGINVMSPGLERKLTTRREIRMFSGRDVQVIFAGPGGREETLVCRLAGLTDAPAEAVVVESEGTEKSIPAADIRSIRLYFEF